MLCDVGEILGVFRDRGGQLDQVGLELLHEAERRLVENRGEPTFVPRGWRDLTNDRQNLCQLENRGFVTLIQVVCGTTLEVMYDDHPAFAKFHEKSDLFDDPELSRGTNGSEYS